MKIGIDIDGCMIDEDEYRLSYMSKYCFEHGLPEPDLPHAYEHKASWWDWEMEHAYRPHYHNEYYRNARIRYCCKEVMDKLKEEGHELVLITGRHPAYEGEDAYREMEEITIKWLEDNEITYDKIVFADYPKTRAILEEKVDVMLDDYEGVMRVCTKEIPCFCYDCVHNQGLDLPNMYRVYTWYDLYRKIHELFID